MATVVTPNKKVRKVRVLIDDGSERTYIRKQIAEELGLEVVGTENVIHSLFGGVKTAVQHHKRYVINLKSGKGKSLTELEVLDQEEICGDISRLTAGSWMQELKCNKIWLSDIGSELLKIDILIGADKCGRILTGKILQLKNGLTAVETILGWTVMGQLEGREHSSVSMIVNNLFISNSSVEQLWALETIGIRDPAEIKSKEEKEMETKNHFLETVSRNEDGRYTVCLPWVNGKQNIPDNRAVAQKRLEYTTRKLKAEGKLQMYNDVFMDWLHEGIIEEVPEKELEKDAHYLPHRAVFKEESTTTPVRPVFDASCKTGRAPSLNECLEKGPNLLEEIPSILLRFREGKVGVISDIRKAFLMIEVISEDRDYLRFLWWQDSEQKKPRILRHKRVVFGVNCSPFLLGAVIEYHLEAVDLQKRKTADKLLKSLYVDNCVTSVENVSEYHVFKKEATEIMANAKMELRMWQSNAVEENYGYDREIDSEEKSIASTLTAVLGLLWDTRSDTLRCNTNFANSVERTTKRIILSTTQKVFDPIGFLCPVLLFPKKLLQETWAKKLGWDEDLDEDITTRFMKWYNQLPLVNDIAIPRNATGGDSDRNHWQLHTFCDASKEAYAAVVFLRTQTEDCVSVQLLQAKSRVAPIKMPTIPRLELMGCTIAARLTHSVKKALSLEHVPEFYWTDSSTALAWIQRNDNWGTFVGNRVREICQLTEVTNWRHIAGVINPADLPSRGCNAAQLLESQWWKGPSWLKRKPEEWPIEKVAVDEDEVVQEIKASVRVGMLSTVNDSQWYVKLSSSYHTTIRIVAWMKRFIDNSRNKSRKTSVMEELSVVEIVSAERLLIKLMQDEVFRGQENTIGGIRVQKSEDGIIRVKTKLLYRDDSEVFRFPMLLPNSHPLVDLLIRHTHIQHGHSGAQFLMGILRENYWILQGRKAIRKILSNCVICRRFSAKKPTVMPAPLPENRVKNATAFEVTGVDLIGPMFIKNKEKAWIVLFTCAVFRCVHLELVQSLSTEAFMDAFYRFCDRRGRPSTVYSDNGTNFVGTVNLFKKIDWEKIARESNIKRIQWIFNPPSAAWWGGWWERLVRTVKDLLKRILGKACVAYEKLVTYLCSVEAHINGRPLTTVTEDLDDLTPLTPAMFLHELPTADVSELDFIRPGDMREHIKKRKNLLDEFKMRFRKEYLSQLVQKGKTDRFREFHVGEVVLVGDDNRKRWQWPLAKVIQLIPGKDGHVRIAKVKTSQGELVRPLQRLFPLEVPSGTELQKVHKVKVN